MTSVSGLSKSHRAQVRAAAAEAALLGYRHKDQIHYTQGPKRWQGIDLKRVASKGQYPLNADCSAYATWCLWNGLYLLYGCRDTVNAAGWKGGFTGTMLDHGKEVVHLSNALRGDCVIYGNGGTGKHTAIIVGTKNGTPMVISHGSEGGPYYLAYNYRKDIMAIRRYV